MDKNTVKFFRGVKAFTLAEILITLVIVGAVATLTIPNLITSYKKNLYVTQLKKAYNEIQSGFKTYMAKQGVTRLDGTTLWAAITSSGLYDSNLQSNSEAFKEFSSIFKIARIYEYGTQEPPFNGSSLRYNHISSNTTYSAAVSSGTCLTSGICMNFHIGNSNPATCDDDYKRSCVSLKEYQETYNTSTKLWQIVGYIDIDVNGFSKGPNQVGRDMFYFYLSNDGNLYPSGGADTAIFNDKNRSGDSNLLDNNQYWRYGNNFMCNPNMTKSYGRGCAARIMEEGWKMNY